MSVVPQPSNIARLIEIGKHGGEIRPDIGKVAKHRRQEAPEQGVLHADQQEPQPQDQPERAVDDRLHQQETADSLAGLVDKLGGGAILPASREPDDAIAKLLTFLKHENDQDDGQGKLSEILHQRRQE